MWKAMLAFSLSSLPLYSNSMYSSPLIAAIEQIESTGNPNAVGDNGAAYGILQIHRGVVEDVNRVYHLKWEHRDMFKPVYARMVFHRYMEIYCTEKRLGRPVTDEDRARIWNGGPNGWEKKRTVNYWLRVKNVLENARD
jgi:hypothetical protein